MRREGGPTAACCPLPPTGLSWPAQDSRAPYKSLPPLVPSPSSHRCSRMRLCPVCVLCVWRSVVVVVVGGVSLRLGKERRWRERTPAHWSRADCCCVISSSDVKERCPSEYLASAASIISSCYVSDLLSVALTSVSRGREARALMTARPPSRSSLTSKG